MMGIYERLRGMERSKVTKGWVEGPQSFWRLGSMQGWREWEKGRISGGGRLIREGV